MRSWREGWAVLAMFLLASGTGAGCNRAAPPQSGAEAGGASAGAEQAESEPPADWPRVLVVGPPAGEPALYFGPRADAPAFGYIHPGVRIRLESGPQQGRIEALVAGALPTKGWIPLDRVAAIAQRRGRVAGTPFYLGPNDYVTVLGPDGQGQMRVAVRPWLGGGTFLDPHVGTFPADQLGDRPVDPSTVEQPTEGQCYVLPPGQTVPVYDHPGGEPVASLPAQDPPMSVVVLRDRAPWYGVRAGYGPYVVGYVQAPLTPCPGPAPAPQPMVPASSGEMPYWMTQERGSLYRVASGTRVTFNGRTIARLRREGWARELGREGDQMDAFIAIDEDVALRGLVPASALTLVEAAGPEAGAPPAPAPATPAAPPPATPAPAPVPDELAE
jgi:hypothetical protein